MIENMTTELNRELTRVYKCPSFRFISLPKFNRYIFANPVSTVIVCKKDHCCTLKLFPGPGCMYKREINKKPDSRDSIKKIAKLVVKNILQIYE